MAINVAILPIEPPTLDSEVVGVTEADTVKLFRIENILELLPRWESLGEVAVDEAGTEINHLLGVEPTIVIITPKQQDRVWLVDKGSLSVTLASESDGALAEVYLRA